MLAAVMPTRRSWTEPWVSENGPVCWKRPW